MINWINIWIGFSVKEWYIFLMVNILMFTFFYYMSNQGGF
jgi:hypothetical protein